MGLYRLVLYGPYNAPGVKSFNEDRGLFTKHKGHLHMCVYLAVNYFRLL